MTTISQAARIASSRNAAYWLQQVNRSLPYGDLAAMVTAAESEGALVSQISRDRFLVNQTAWVHAGGCVSPAS